MRQPLLATLACAATLALCQAPAWAHGENKHGGHGAQAAASSAPTAFGRAGNPVKVTRTIRIEMTDTMRFTPSTLQVKPGETVRFVLHNSGHILHEMVLGDAKALQRSMSP